MIGTPAATNGAVSRVATAKPFTVAIAAICASATDSERPWRGRARPDLRKFSPRLRRREECARRTAWRSAPPTPRRRLRGACRPASSRRRPAIRRVDRRQIQRLRRLTVEPVDDGRSAVCLHRLGNDVRVENDHANDAGSVGEGSRVVSRSTPPKRRPNAASSAPSFSRPLGRTASSRIARTSASALRP